MQFYLETDRLIIRNVEEKDIQGIFELDSDIEVHKYLGNRPIQTTQDAASIVKYIQDQYSNNGLGRWAVIDKNTNEFIGWSGLKFETEVRNDMDYYDLGYRLKRKFWGRGIATETSMIALKYGFQDLKLDSIYAGAHVENIGSNKVLEKVGMKRIEVIQYDGMPHNWYGVTKSDWNQ
ncbi:MAG: GNAT family N-acetyltransferase [Saprospiraceae bacterium]|nr:GNAT family N-acetyltransferase [Saprospiraceae bacterium]